jgi:hypothetical protein
MKKRRIISLAILCSVVLLSCNDNLKCASIEKNNYKIEYQTDLKKLTKQEEFEVVNKTYDMIKCIKEKRIDDFWSLPFYNFGIMVDSIDEYYFTLKEIKKDFQKEGMVYQLLFDSEKYYTNSKSDIDRRSRVMGREDYRLCIRDVLLKYPKLAIRDIVVQSSDSVAVYFDWVERNKTGSAKIQYYCYFSLIDNVWYHSSVILRTF